MSSRLVFRSEQKRPGDSRHQGPLLRPTGLQALAEQFEPVLTDAPRIIVDTTDPNGIDPAAIGEQVRSTRTRLGSAFR